MEKGYDRRRSRGEKQAIVRRIAFQLWQKHGCTHRKDAILKKWSDLKRHRMDLITKIRDKSFPGTILICITEQIDNNMLVREISIF